MKTVNAAAQALLNRAIAGELIPMPLLVYLNLAVPQRWTLDGRPVTWGGFTWSPQEVLFDKIKHSLSQIAGVRITVPGVTLSQRALAFEDVDGAAVELYMGVQDPATLVVEDAISLWAGVLDSAGFEDGPQPSVVFTAEHRGDYAMRQRVLRYTNAEQQRLYSGDTSLDYDPALDAAPVVWPAAAYWKQ